MCLQHTYLIKPHAQAMRKMKRSSMIMTYFERFIKIYKILQSFIEEVMRIYITVKS